MALLVVGVLAALSLGPIPKPDLPGPLERIPHTAAYALGTYVLLSIAHHDTHRPRWGRITAIAVSVVLLGAALEAAQHLVDRDVEIMDVVANSLGVAAAIVTWILVRRR